ncbi:MAG: DUF2087 domain-containing protein [Alphaproteobacteria bacterium]
MVKTTIPFYCEDISQLAKSITAQLKTFEKSPSHLEVLNILAKAKGFRNFQHFKASDISDLEKPEDNTANEISLENHNADSEIDEAKIKKIMRYFDNDMRLIRWPSKESHRLLCIWVLWSNINSKQSFSEKEISSKLDEMHLFGDYALLRRWLCDYGLMTRNSDGSNYQRVELVPSVEVKALIKALKMRKG